RAQNLKFAPSMELAWWARPGISQENEARLNAALATIVLTFIVGWTYAVYRSFAHNEPPPGITRVASNPLADDAPPVAAYAADAAIATSAKLIGASHKVHDIASVLPFVPLSEKKNGRIGTYLIGNWPYE